MAQIPQYESKVLPSGKPANAIIPTIPTSLANQGPEAAVARAGAEMSEIGLAWTKKLTEAKQGQEYSSNMAQLHVGLSNLYGKITTDPQYISNPDAGKQVFQEQSRKMMDEQVGKISDQHVKARVQAHSEDAWAAHSIAVNNWNRNQHVQNLHSGGLQNVQTFSDAIANSETDEIFHKNMNQMLTTIEGLGPNGAGAITQEQYINMKAEAPRNALLRKAESEIDKGPGGPSRFLIRLEDPDGIYKGLNSDDKGKLRYHAAIKEHSEKTRSERDDNKAKSEAREQKYNWIVGTVNKDFDLGSSDGSYVKYGSAIKSVLSSEGAKAFGVEDDPALQMEVVKYINAKETALRNQDVKAQQDTNIEAWNKAINGNMALDGVPGYKDDKTNLGISPDQQEKMKKYLAQTDWEKKTGDDALRWQIYQDLMKGKITDRQQYWDKVMQGISPDDAIKFDSVFSKLHDDFVKKALGDFNKKVKDALSLSGIPQRNPEIIERAKTAFYEELHDAIDSENLTKFGITTKAEELYPKYMKNIKEVYDVQRQKGKVEQDKKKKESESSWWSSHWFSEPKDAKRAENPVSVNPQGHPIYKNGEVDTSVKVKATSKDSKGNIIYKMQGSDFQFTLKPKGKTESPDIPAKTEQVVPEVSSSGKKDAAWDLMQEDLRDREDIPVEDIKVKGEQAEVPPMTPDDPIPGDTELSPEMTEHTKQEWGSGYNLHGFIDKYGLNAADQTGGKHLTDEFKLPWHITFSDESKYSKPGQEGGHWANKGTEKKPDWHFTASPFNLTKHSAEELKAQAEKEGFTLHLPESKPDLRSALEDDLKAVLDTVLPTREELGDERPSDAGAEPLDGEAESSAGKFINGIGNAIASIFSPSEAEAADNPPSENEIRIEDKRPGATSKANYTGNYPKSAVESIVHASNSYGVDPYTALAVILAESRFGTAGLFEKGTKGPQKGVGVKWGMHSMDAIKVPDKLSFKDLPPESEKSKERKDEMAEIEGEAGDSYLRDPRWIALFREEQLEPRNMALATDDALKSIKAQLDYGGKIGAKSEAMLIQAIQGYGKVRGESGNVTDRGKNPIYGKIILALREHAIKSNPEIRKIVEDSKKKHDRSQR